MMGNGLNTTIPTEAHFKLHDVIKPKFLIYTNFI